jgi:putative DNA methylase
MAANPQPSPAHEPSLLELGSLPIAELSQFAAREGKRQRPIYGMHKWYARRAGAAFRALLVAAHTPASDDFWEAYYGDADLSGVTVLDSFVGGGTSMVEAGRLGAQVIGFDVDPVACAVTTLETEAAGIPDLQDALTDLKQEIGVGLSRYYRTSGPDGEERVVVHYFWVQVVDCGQCGEEVEAHPHYRLAYQADGRKQWCFCPECHDVVELDNSRKQVDCSCGHRYKIGEGVVDYGRLTCRHCGHREPLIEIARRSGDRPQWRLFAHESIAADVERHPVPMADRLFQRATDDDRARYKRAAALLKKKLQEPRYQWLPTDAIPTGLSDDRLHDYGYNRYRELFNDRQLLHLALLGESISRRSGTTKRALALAYSDHLATNCMLTCFAFGWRRLVPLFSVRGFRHIPRPVEINPWLDGTGRGTFPNAVRQIERAAAFARAPKEPTEVGEFKEVAPRAAPAARIVNGDARALTDVADGSVDIVLTDPPYFDNINYSELSDFFRPWLAALGVIGNGNGRAANLAAAGRGDLEALDFQHRLGDAFAEIARVLKPEGVVALTYRHLSPVAWRAFARAAGQAGLRCLQVFPLLAESTNGLHTHEGSVLWDAVLVLGRASLPAPGDRVDDAQVAAAAEHAAEWALTLKKGVAHTFAAADRTSFARACLVAASLDCFGHAIGETVPLGPALAAVE